MRLLKSFFHFLSRLKGPFETLLSSCSSPRPWIKFHFVMILNPIPIFLLFSTIYSALLVTRSPLVPSHAAQTATWSPDKSPDRSLDHSTVNYHMPSFRSSQHSTASPFIPLWIASSQHAILRLPAHDRTILRTATSWCTLLNISIFLCDLCDPLLLICI